MPEFSEFFKKFYRKYADACEFAELRFKPQLVLGLTIVLMAACVSLSIFLDITLCFLLTVLVLDLGLGMPFYLADRKVDQIESRLPDVLHHIGTTLKTGGTIEVALHEVSRIDYGPITQGTKTMLREINEGKTFEDSFTDFAVASKSKLLKKAAVIIIAAKRSGGGLLDTLIAMAEDMRQLYRLKRERKTKTFMQFLFILVAGCLIAPFVFGIVKSVLEILLKVGGGVISVESTALISQFDFLFKGYLVVASALTVLSAVQVREGSISKAIIYLPWGVLATYLIYTVISTTFLSFMAGGGMVRT